MPDSFYIQENVQNQKPASENSSSLDEYRWQKGPTQRKEVEKTAQGQSPQTETGVQYLDFAPVSKDTKNDDAKPWQQAFAKWQASISAQPPESLEKQVQNASSFINLAKSQNEAGATEAREAAKHWLKGKEETCYRQWYQSLSDKNVDQIHRLTLAHDYVKAFERSASDESATRVKSAKVWLTDELKRPSVEINLSKYVRSGNAPSTEDIGNMVADVLGFTESEKQLYASLKGSKSIGLAFFQPADAEHEGINWLKLAKNDPLGRVRISEMHPGAIGETRQWLLDFRARHAGPNPINDYDYDKQRTVMEGIIANVYNPIAGGAGAAIAGVGDIVQGLGLPLHAVFNHTFMDSLAEEMRKAGGSLPMYSLYTQAELNDAVVGLANIYCLAAGSAAPYMAGGLLARGAAISPRAVGLVGELTGLAGTTGQVYDAALDIQAAEIAKAEGNSSEGQLLSRIDQIKKGKDISPENRSQIESRALVAAALSAPAGIVQGKYLKDLCGHVAAGTPADQIPRTLLKDIANSLVKGGAISAAQHAYLQTTLFVSGVQSGEQSLKNGLNGLPEAAAKGAVIGAGHEMMRQANQQAKGQRQVSRQEPPEDSNANGRGQNKGQMPEQPIYNRQQTTPEIPQPARPAINQAPNFDVEARVNFERQIQQVGFQADAEGGAVKVYKGPVKPTNTPGDRDVWYVSGDSKQFLRGENGWYYGKETAQPETVAPIKVHVLTSSPEDLKALQSVLIPEMQKDSVLNSAPSWKTMDPAEGFGRGQYKLDGQGQNGKAFTIYARTPQEAARIHSRVDEILARNNLSVRGPIVRGTTDVPTGASGRVALSVDFFDRTMTRDNRHAAIVDAAVENTFKYRAGIPKGQQFTDAQLRQLEANCGLKQGILSYDTYGRLALSLEGRPKINQNKIYVDESGADSNWGSMTGRFAMYSLFRGAALEPSRLLLSR